MYKSESLEFNLQEFEEFNLLNAGVIEALNSAFPVLSNGNILTEQDETLDATFHVMQDMSPRGPPEKKADPGKLNFKLELNSMDTNKYLYSHILNRIYVNMETNFPIQFNWNQEDNELMFVRAMVVFSDESQAEKRVERCVQHEHSASNDSISPHIYKNVLHSARELGTQGVEYCGDPSIPDSWYSVRVQFNKTSSEPVTHAYKFVCKNSCSTGINRRSIAIIFTLENLIGEVLGRQLLGARVCACPRRDIRKDEESEGVFEPGRKRVASNQIATPKPTKKIKIEVVKGDENVLTLPPLKVVGEKAMIAGLEMMLRMMEQAAELTKHDPQSVETYSKHLDDFRKSLADIRKKKTL